MVRPKAKFRLKANVWPKAVIRLKANNGKLFLLIASMMASFTPSQNILQSLQKWKDILEYITINWELLKSPNRKKFGTNCSPSEILSPSEVLATVGCDASTLTPLTADKLWES